MSERHPFISLIEEIKAAAAAQAALSDKGMEGLRVQVRDGGVEHSRSQILNWLYGKTLPEQKAFATVSRVLGLPYQNWQDAEGVFGPLDWSGPAKRRSDNNKPSVDVVEEALRRIDNAQQGFSAIMRQMATDVNEVFANLNGNHFYVATTINSMPLILDEDGKIPGGMFDSRVKAIIGGALFALIVPTKDYLEELQEQFRFQPQLRPADFNIEARYEFFREQLIARLERTNIPNPRRVAHERAQLFQWKSFPLTMMGLTVTLLGVREKGGAFTKRTLVRGRFPDTNSFLVLPHSNDRLEDWLEQFTSQVLDETKKTEAEQPGDEATWRRNFITELRKRMKR